MDIHCRRHFACSCNLFDCPGIRCSIAAKDGEERITAYNAVTVTLSYGDMTYVDSVPDGNSAEDKVILSVHGIFGGYVQAYDTVEDFASSYRILAPSRFGYLGSVAIRFALDYPERTEGLILYCSAMPYTEKPEKYMEYAGPHAFLCNDYGMFLISPLFDPIMGMEPSTIYSMLPCGDRKTGVVLDASVTNPDMARNFDSYPIESLQVPTLILQAKDDKLVSFADTEKGVQRFPNCTFIPFESGGHLMAGHGDEIRKAVADFMN